MSPASAAHRPWRKSHTPTTSAGSTRFKRWFFSLLGLTLAGLFIWFLILPLFTSQTRVLVASAGQDFWSSGAIAFADNDAAAINSVAYRGTSQALPAVESADDLRGLADAMSQAVKRQKDTVVLYLNAQGLSESGSAQLACGEFPFDERIDVKTLLTRLEDCPARVKLLVLDTVHIESDPRLGIVVNEFPKLLEETVRRRSDPNLWVLTSCSLLEKSIVSYSAQQSLFAQYVRRALAGEADTDGSETISVGELFDFVHAGVRRASGGQQTPQLLHSDADTANKAELIDFMAVKAQPAAEESVNGEGTAAAALGMSSISGLAVISPLFAQAAPTAEGGNPATTGEAKPAGQPTAEKPAGESTSQGTPPTKEPETSKAAEPQPSKEPARIIPRSSPDQSVTPRALMLAAWKLRDQLQSRVAGRPSPIDFAPHLWRELDARLLAYEANLRCGKTHHQGELATDIERIEELFRDSKYDFRDETRSLPRRLRDAILAERSQSSAGAPSVQELEQVRNDAEFLAPYFVQWHDTESFYSPDPVAVKSDLERFFTSLAEFRLPGQADAAQLEDLNHQAKELSEMTRDLRGRIEKRAQELIDSGKPYVSQRIEVLLSTPLLSADSRMQLVDILTDPKLLQVESERALLYSGAGDGVARWRWDRVQDRASLDLLLVSMVDSSLAQDGAVPKDDKVDARLEQYRAVGGRLQQFYRDLPRAIESATRSSGKYAPHDIPRLLRLVDARDAATIDDSVYEYLRPLPPLKKPESHLVFEDPLASTNSLRLNFENWTDLKLVVDAAGERSDGDQLSMVFDDRKVEVRAKDGPSVSTGQPMTIAPPKEGRWEVVYQVRAKPGQRDLGSLSMKLTGGDKPDSRDLKLSLPQPDRVSLAVRRLPAEAAPRDRWTRTEGEITSLRPFPNRITKYYFTLNNESQRDKKVKLELFDVPTIKTSQPPEADQIHAWVLDGRANLLGQSEKEIVLPMGAASVPVSFATFPPVPMPGTAPAPSQTSQPPMPPPVRPVPNSLACIITDLDQPNRRWVHWINLAPLSPWRYLDPIVRYDVDLGRILVDLKSIDYNNDGKDDIELTPLAEPDSAISVSWDITRELPENPPANTAVKLTRDAPRQQLFAEVKPREQPVLVELEVDGYPRAFLYRVRPTADRAIAREVAREREFRRVQIRMDKTLQLINVPAPPKLPPDLQFTLMIDAPEDVFPSADHSVEYGIDANQDREFTDAETKFTRHSDREVSNRLIALSADGSMAIECRVSDFNVTLPVGGYRNDTIDVRGELILDGESVQSAFVPVVLDGTDPSIEARVEDDRVLKGEPINIRVSATDQGSGVESVKYKVTRDRQDTIKDEDKLESLSSSDEENWVGSIDSAGLPVGQHIILLRADDKVARRSRTASVIVNVLQPPPPPKPDENKAPAKPTKGTLRGVVVFAGEPVAGAKVKMSGAKTDSTTTGRDGSFKFDNLSAGAYTFEVEGTAKNKIRRGKGSADFTPPSLPRPVSIEVE